jgi:putative addiction module killer protein
MRTEFVAISYQTAAGKRPFDEWMEKLRRRDRVAAEIIDSRLARIRDRGNFGDCRSVGHGVGELRIHFGPGYRIYYLLHGHKLVVMLAGGQKGTQRRDIERAYEYASDFRRRI